MCGVWQTGYIGLMATRRTLRLLLPLLLAWLMAFQAVAGVGHCRHAGGGATSAAAAMDHAAMGHGSMDHAGNAQAPDTSTALGDCTCGCHCAASHCSAAGPALGAASSGLTSLGAATPLRARRAATGVAAAHGLGLLRPPSIS